MKKRLLEGTAMDQTKAVPLETSTPLNAWLLTPALSPPQNILLTAPLHTLGPGKHSLLAGSEYAGLLVACICRLFKRPPQKVH